MAYAYQQDFPPVIFSTFKPIPQNRDEPSSHTAYHEEDSQQTGMAIEAKNKITDSSTVNSVHKESSRNTGTTLKDQTYQWFERTQRKKLLRNSRFADWFHGFITRTGSERCRHFMLDQMEDEQYMIEGEKSVHPSLEDLINHYSRFPVEPYKEMLTTACPMNRFQHKISCLSERNPQEAIASGKMYATICKQKQTPPDTAPRLSTSPKAMNKVLCDGRIPEEYASSSSVRKVPVPPRKEPVPSPQDLDPHLARAPAMKPSDDGSNTEVMSPHQYNPSEEMHTYSEPDLRDRPRVECNDNASDPIAFYAVGRGSCTLENVYSEVDLNSMTSCKARAAMHPHGGLFTLPHPVPKAAKRKPKAFHSSFRSHKPSTANQEDARRGHSSRCNTKAHATLQLDDPMYGQGHLQHGGPPDLNEENIYEKIPENCVGTLRNNHPGRKAR